MMPKRAFTLIELLVVIAIIGILLAVLVPGLSAAIQTARRVQCASNLRELTMAWHMYLDDNDGRFYQGKNANLLYGGFHSISEAEYDYPKIRPLNSYLNRPQIITQADDAKVFLCPADRGGAPNEYCMMKTYLYFGTSYQTNIFLIGQNAFSPLSVHTAEFDRQLSSKITQMSRSKVTAPASALILMGDYGWFNQWRPRKHAFPEVKELAEWHGKPDHHNLAFLDGHVKFTHIPKGYYVTDDYTVVPFADMISWATEVQGPEE